MQCKSINLSYETLGITLTEDKERLILVDIKELAIKNKRTLTEMEFLEILNRHQITST